MAQRFMPTMLLGTALLLACSGGRDATTTAPPASSRRAAAAAQALPPPTLDGTVSLERVLATRRSVRRYQDRPLSLAQKGQLLWAAQGITDAERGLRTAPSAGALYGLIVYLADDSGVYRYEPHGHGLLPHVGTDIRSPLAEAGLGQKPLQHSPVIIVIAGEPERLVERYGSQAAQHYTILESAHAAQNVLLQVTAMGLGSVPIAAFDADAVGRVVKLPKGEKPLYLIPVGYPREQQAGRAPAGESTSP
jgi:SagB-type dehydrogenase family enzyme